MRQRWLRALGVWLVLVAILVSPGGGKPPAALLAAPGSDTPTPGPDVRAQAVPRLAAERDRLRATQASRAARQPPPPGVTATAAPGGAVRAEKLGFGLADVSTGPGTTLELAARAGAGWMLGWVSWQNVEPSRGAFAWQAGGANDLDNVAEGGRAYGLKVLVRVQSPPAWATADGSGHLSQVNPDEVRRSMEALARRGAGRVAAYQVFNEPNLTYEWGADVDAAAAAGYARLLRAAYQGLKAGDPQALVVSAGMANGATAPSLNDLDYLRAFYAAGARGTFDVLDTHPYGGNTPPESTDCGGTCFRRAEVQRQIMVDAGDSATPMWATELGWLHESDYDMGPYFEWHKVTAQQQADYLVRAFQYAERFWPWMGPMFVFNHDHSTAMWCGGPCYPPTTSVYWFSVLNPDRSARPAYTALVAMPKLPGPATRAEPPVGSTGPTAARTGSRATVTPSPTARPPAGAARAARTTPPPAATTAVVGGEQGL